ncbi:DNA ligase D [Luteibacter sp. SG786]|uniref:DNA ligase D n=1 Tax=Luteibacter sp. SG786 TaxID=2587130 RepID=UPI0014230022|nr:DNA ligase D [Luteibacter sp. SG786]NII55777.1 bifunctional non-homologous end joining protein LigD [Luteibacter sp. SG786]
MSLQDYRRKRNFARTREPAPDDSVREGGRAIFVVQLHHASRRHFDFRLQVGDVLRSWAVPKGPSYDPKVKRLAVEVEDHPVSYADFEGDIEEGYGKGHVDLFDRGVWATRGDPEAQIRKGHLEFELFGKRLKGRWHLVRGGRKERQPTWFLIKAEDAYAGDVEADDLLDAKMRESTRRAATTPNLRAAAKKSTSRKKAPPKTRRVPLATLTKAAAALKGARKAKPDNGFFPPQLARLRDTPPQGDGWVHEVKWDGYRILTGIAGGKALLWSRNALPWNERAPEIAQAVEALGLDSARLDGELIALDAEGRSDFNALQRTLSGEAQAPLVYMLFDIPYLQGYDLSRTALVERKALLERLLAHAPPHLSYSSHQVGHGDEVFAMAMEQKLEGIISKRAEGAYHSGRGDDWQKIKRLESDEFAVVGYTPAKGSRLSFGSLLLAKPGKAGRWTYVGRVGTGFTDEMLRELAKTLAKGGTKKPPVHIDAVDPMLRGALWVPPTVVAEVYYRGIGNKDLLRQPSLKTLRVDKSPADLRDSDRAPAAPPAKKPRGTRKASSKAGAKAVTADAIVITHPDRVVFPDDGITKQEVVDYYRAVMPWMLPAIADRPTSTIRCPGGIGAPCFFQKHVMAGLEHVGTAKLKEETGAQAVYLYPRDEAGLIELVQFGAVEFHPWGSHVDAPDIADRVVFDLDPGDDVAWPRVVAAARMVRGFLDQLGLVSFVRTTGGKGLHVVVPLNPGADWDTVKTFARGFAEAMAALHPLEFVATATKRFRRGKIYVDYLRNGRGATAVASYSLRSRPGAPVAVPLRWEELGKVKSGNAFDLHSVPKRLARLKKDPWDGIDKVKQNLASVNAKLRKL